MPRCAWARTIAPAWSSCCANVLGDAMSGLYHLAVDGSGTHGVPSWPIRVAQGVDSERPQCANSGGRVREAWRGGI